MYCNYIKMCYTVIVKMGRKTDSTITEGVLNMEGKKINVWKIIIISASVAAAVAALCITAYKLFKKYFKITFDCGEDCEECPEGCFSDDFGDDDFIPECTTDEDDITVESAE